MNDEDIECDVLIIGSGAGGLATALVCHHFGLKVMIVEKEAEWGGTTAVSSGAIWAPLNSFSASLGIPDGIDLVRRYLQETCPHHVDAQTEVFLANVGPALDFLQSHSAARFLTARGCPDYHPEAPGGTFEGRMVWPLPIDGRELGQNFFTLRPPLKQTMLFGGMIVGVPEVQAFLRAFRSLDAALFTAQRLMGYLRDRLTAPRGYALQNGNALLARLGKSVFDAEIPICLNTAMKSLTVDGGTVVGAIVQRNDVDMAIKAHFGIVLATGGASGSEAFRQRYFAHVQRGVQHHTLVPPGVTGDGLFAAEKIGAAIEASASSPVIWSPISMAPQRSGPELPFPSMFDRAKPGFIAVGPDGRRFTNEAAPYQVFVPEMIKAAQKAGANAGYAWLIGSRVSARKYGIGAARPAPFRIGPHLRSGYIKRGENARELARNIGVDPDTLVDTIARYNMQAIDGVDRDFGRGTSAFDRFLGDPMRSPNPCVGPVEGELYAVKIQVGDVGTTFGIQVDASSQVVDTAGKPIPNLYSVGADSASIFGGGCPGGGSALGPALAFAYVAGRSIAKSAGKLKDASTN